MTDETTTPEDGDGTNASPRRPSPNPASRARRIGGRPTPRPAPGPRPAPDAGSPVSVLKDAPRRPARAPESRQRTQSDSESAQSGSAQSERVRARPTPSPGPGSERTLALRWIPAGVLGLAVIALAAWLVVASHGVYWAKPDDSAGARTVRQGQVLAAAKKCFAQINTYDYRKLTGLVQRDTPCTTGTFTNDLTRALQTQIIPLAPKLKATQTAQINRAGIASVSPSGNQVVTLMYGQLSQTNTNTAKNTPRIDVVGAIVTVDRVGGQWLISKVDSDVGNLLGS